MAVTVYEIDGMAHVDLLKHMNALAGFPDLTSRQFAAGCWWVAQDTESFEAVGFACLTEDENRIFVLQRCAGEGIENQFTERWEAKSAALGWK